MNKVIELITSSDPALLWSVEFLDQSFLPSSEIRSRVSKYEDLILAIVSSVIRGSTVLGIAGAYGMVLAAKQASVLPVAERGPFLTRAVSSFKLAHDAVNLHRDVDRMFKRLQSYWSEDSLPSMAEREAGRIYYEEVLICKSIGRHGSRLIGENSTILTMDNTGALVMGEYGTAMGIIRASHEEGSKPKVLICETRPFFSGSKLAAWELQQAKIPVEVICDNAAAHLMRKKVSYVIVGADSVARNGDILAKAGTYNLAVLADYHSIPFFVAAPALSVDLTVETGEGFELVEYPSDSVLMATGVRVAPRDVDFTTPVQDVTPSALISAIVTEQGILYPPYVLGLQELSSLTRNSS